MNIIILTEKTLIWVSCGSFYAVLIIPRTCAVMKPCNLNPTKDLKNSSQLREVHQCSATVQAFCSTVRWFFFPFSLGSLTPDTCFLLQLPSLLGWGSCQLHAKDSLFTWETVRSPRRWQRIIARQEILCYRIFRVKYRNATSCLDKWRKIDASSPLLRFRDVLKNNFCFLVTG